jgi:hypothetical protein
MQYSGKPIEFKVVVNILLNLAAIIDVTDLKSFVKAHYIEDIISVI